MGGRGFDAFRQFGIGPPPDPGMSYWRLPMQLFPFQQEAVDTFLRQRHGTVLLPTASGKTIIAIALIIALKVPTVILVPTKALLEQVWEPRLKAAGITPGKWFGEEKRPGFVLISTYQSLFQNPELIRGYPFVIFDEGDVVSGEAWSKLQQEAKLHPYAAVITATLPPEEERAKALTSLFPVIIERTPKEQIEQGFFVPVEIVPRYVQLSFPARKRYDEIVSRMRRLRGVLGTGNPRKIRALLTKGTLPQRKAAGAHMALQTERQGILAHVPERAEALLDIVRSHPGMRVLVFGTRVDPLADALAFLTMNGLASRIISAETTPRDRRYIFEHWGRDLQVVGSVDVLTRGIDVPEAAVAAILGGGSGERRLIQRIGRIVRTSEGKSIATVYLVVAVSTTEDRLVEVTRKIFAGGPAPEDEDEEEEDLGDGDTGSE